MNEHIEILLVSFIYQACEEHALGLSIMNWHSVHKWGPMKEIRVWLKSKPSLAVRF